MRTHQPALLVPPAPKEVKMHPPCVLLGVGRIARTALETAPRTLLFGGKHSNPGLQGAGGAEGSHPTKPRGAVTQARERAGAVVRRDYLACRGVNSGKESKRHLFWGD